MGTSWAHVRDEDGRINLSLVAENPRVDAFLFYYGYGFDIQVEGWA